MTEFCSYVVLANRYFSLSCKDVEYKQNDNIKEWISRFIA